MLLFVLDCIIKQTITQNTFGHITGERVHSSYTRVVVVVWLFVVFLLASSYTASHSSMLTVQRFEPNITDIEWLKKNNAPVGCDFDSFIKQYLQNVLKFDPRNIKNINNEYDYPTEFESRNITAAFVELPYSKAFMKHFCRGYTVATPTDGLVGSHRFGGLGFVFQKGSPIAEDVSHAILTLSENRKLEQLETLWFTPSPKCLNSLTFDTIDSLSWKSFWGLSLFSAFISTICYILFATHQSYMGSISFIYSTMLYKLAGLVKYLYIVVRKPQGTIPNTVHSSSTKYTSSLETLGQSQAPTSSGS
ncbi:unnamed protein product [Ilex paraguariensis]|uniref:Ionotropic glutamate receptor C-terminal domain-containing protein n=1 Tax=Ilex paraguariensis TaxID=185542 RepID=A0ABC8RZM4_9AQUA